MENKGLYQVRPHHKWITYKSVKGPIVPCPKLLYVLFYCTDAQWTREIAGSFFFRMQRILHRGFNDIISV